jgi:hypothetical protein
LANHLVPLSIGEMRVARVGGFVAVVPQQNSPALQDFAMTIVRELDGFRAPLTAADIARRNPDRLNDRQRAHLMTWGYPHLMEDLKRAERTIYLQFYTWADDAFTRELKAILIERGIVDPANVDRILDYFEESLGPQHGARVVATAWVDEAFRDRLLRDGTAAVRSMGISGPEIDHLVVVENTDTVHNVVVCTLCSCYPWAVLGLPPAWPKSGPFEPHLGQGGLAPSPVVLLYADGRKAVARGGDVGGAYTAAHRQELHEPARARPGQVGLVCSGRRVRSVSAGGGGGGSSGVAADVLPLAPGWLILFVMTPLCWSR